MYGPACACLTAVRDGQVSFDIPEYTGEITALGTIRILEAIRETGINCKFYQASSSEMYGKARLHRAGAGSSAERNHALLSAQSLCSG